MDRIESAHRPFLSPVLLAAIAVLGWTGTAMAKEKAAPRPYLHPPSVETYATHDPAGVTILSNGRHIRPEGRSFPLPRNPHGLTVSRDGSVLFVASDSTGNLVTRWQEAEPTFRAIQPANEAKKKHRTATGGADFSADGKLLWWSAGEDGAVNLFDTATGKQIDQVALNIELGGRKFEDSYIIDVRVSPDGRHVYCADVANFRVVVIDAETRAVVSSTPMGRYPYALAPVGQEVWAANIGVFEYSAIPATTDPRFDKRGLTRPPFGFPSREARDGVEFEGRRIPGLGDPNVPESFSVWGLDVADPAHPRVSSRIKTGLLMGAPADNGKTVGGSAPNFLAANADALFVSNGNNDLIERIDLKSRQVTAARRLTPSPAVEGLRGVSPSGMALSPKGDRLYVAELGINAIAVLDTRDLRVLGHIPTAWYPYRVAVSPDGKSLACICFRGFGNGPNAGSNVPKSPFLGLRGVLTVMDIPGDDRLPELTGRVLAYNGMEDKEADRKALSSPVIPTVPGTASEQIRYVVFITKENHTFDAIFDRIPGARHDPSLLRWGLHQTIRQDGQPTLTNAAVMVNHNALARQFTVSDNFYMEPEASGVGHRWLVGVQPNNLMQMTYSVGWSFKKDSTAPGRRYSMGSNGSLIPEDYPEAGSMWDHLGSRRIRFRNYGEGFEFPGVGEDEDESPTGAREVVNVPMPKILYDNTCFGFPIFNMNIPDQYRAHWFMKDVQRRYIRGFRRFPSFLNIAICNDHGSDPKPDKGYPYLASWMADNDLALGRIVDFLSHTPYWKNMVIFVTQDDSGGEPDHVDAQRSVLLAISPWVKRGNVSHRHTTITSMHRTMYQVFGLPPLNLFDALANDFSDCFTTTPDFTPYTFQPVDARIFDPEKAKDPKDPDYGVARKMRSIPMDDDDDMEEILRRGEKETGGR
jgi:YVTN family beta-propeller protein